MIDKMKPCPKCTSKFVGLQTDINHPLEWQGTCVSCGHSGAWAQGKWQAIEKWNDGADGADEAKDADD